VWKPHRILLQPQTAAGKFGQGLYEQNYNENWNTQNNAHVYIYTVYEHITRADKGKGKVVPVL
jgi:hypothetical protein